MTRFLQGTFEQLLTLDEPRKDCPMHLPGKKNASFAQCCTENDHLTKTGSGQTYIGKALKREMRLLPEPPPIASPWTCPGCHNSPAEELRRLAELEADSDRLDAQHCPAKTQVRRRMPSPAGSSLPLLFWSCQCASTEEGTHVIHTWTARRANSLRACVPACFALALSPLSV